MKVNIKKVKSLDLYLNIFQVFFFLLHLFVFLLFLVTLLLLFLLLIDFLLLPFFSFSSPYILFLIFPFSAFSSIPYNIPPSSYFFFLVAVLLLLPFISPFFLLDFRPVAPSTLSTTLLMPLVLLFNCCFSCLFVSFQQNLKA